MNPLAQPGEDEVHATAPQPHTQAQSRWPSLGAAGLVILAVGLMVFLPLVAVGLLAIVVSILGVALEVNPRPEHRPAHAQARAQDDFPKHLWLALGLMVASGMVLISILRAFVAHGLLLPERWPEPARDLATPVAFLATGLLIVSFPVALAGGWAMREERRILGPGLIAAAIALAIGFLAALGLQWLRLADDFVLPDSAAAGAYYSLTGYHALNVVAIAIFFSIVAWHSAVGRLEGKAGAVLKGALAYWGFVVAGWLVTFLVIYLRLITWEGRALLED